MNVTVVVPTIGRASLTALLHALSLSAATASGPVPVVLVDDRAADAPPLALPRVPRLDVTVVRSGGRGPAAARNVGRRAVDTAWLAFLDDDVVPDATWWDDLAEDLASAGPDVAAVQGLLRVPLPDRRPTDWERQTAALEQGYGITADLAVRATALDDVHGFDERFRRAFREDADLGLRLRRSGWRVTSGRRRSVHPVRPAPWWISVARQAGNADDVLMDRLHPAGWRDEARAGRSRLRQHLAVVVLTSAGVALTAGRRRRGGAGALIAGAAILARFALQRIAPGPRTPGEVATMAVTTVAIPYVAVAHHLAGRWRWRHAAPWPPARSRSVAGTTAAVAPPSPAVPRTAVAPPTAPIEEMAR